MVEAKDVIPLIVLGGLILLGMRRRAEEEMPPPPPEEKPPLPGPPWPYPPILAPPPPEEIIPPPEEIVAPPEIPYPIEFLRPPPRREEIMPMAVAAVAPPPPPPREELPTPPPEEVPPVPPELIQLPKAPPIEVRLFGETEFMKSYEIILSEGDIVTDVYPLGAENTVISLYNIYTKEQKLRSFRAPEGYVVVSYSQSGNWDTGTYRAFIHVGVKRLYAVPWVHPPRPPRHLMDMAVATGMGEVTVF